MGLSKNDNQMSKGIAIIGMVMLHLFCRMENLPYTPLIWIGSTPLIYYFGLFGDLCVPIYCFCSGYAQALLFDKEAQLYRKRRYDRLLKFLINYWIVLVVFSIVGLISGSTSVPGTWLDFLGNLFLYDISYNGAWWFVLTYVFLVLCSPCLCKISKKLNPIVLFVISGVLYFVAYLFRFYIKLDMPHTILAKIWEQLILFGTSQFSFVVGIIFYQQRLMEKLRAIKIKPVLKTVICLLVIALLFVIHAIEQSLIIAPITGIVTMVCFHLMHKSKWVEKVFLFFGKHSTNIWLVHMFFYLIIFENLVFVAKYPILILLLMFAICIAVSYIIDFMNAGLNKLIFREKKKQ